MNFSISFGFLKGTAVPYSILTFLVVLFSAIICAVPRGTHVTLDQYSAVKNLMSSIQYRDSLLLSIAVSIPLLVDNILDFVSIIGGSASEKLHWTARFFLLMSLLLPNIYLYSRVMSLSLSASDFLSALTLIRSTSRGCICIYLSQDHFKLGLGPICASISLCYLIEQLLWLATYVEDNRQLGIVSLSLTGIIHLQLFLIFAKCFIDLRQSGRESSAENLCICIYLSSYLLLSVGSLVIPLAFDDKSLSTATPEKVSLYSYLQIVFTIMAMTVSGRVARFKSLKSETALLEQKAFIRYISHELRTPLNAVFLGMTLVRDELTNICPPAKDYVQNILETVDDVNDCCEAAISILNDLLTFDKLQEGKMTLDFEETAILEYVSESIRPFRAEARQKNIEITMRVDDAENEGWDQLSALHVDPHRMSQVLRNLLSNALKFTPSGGLVALLISRVSRREFKHLQKYPPSHVRSLKRNAVQPLEVTSGASGAAKELLNNCVRIEITDTGAGISEENQKKLFGQYMQFHAGRLQGGKGSGLGLWISKGIVGLHGGNIGAMSAGEGRGSTFFVELPLHPRRQCNAIRSRSFIENDNVEDEFAMSVCHRKSNSEKDFMEDAQKLFGITSPPGGSFILLEEPAPGSNLLTMSMSRDRFESPSFLKTHDLMNDVNYPPMSTRNAIAALIPPV